MKFRSFGSGRRSLLAMIGCALLAGLAVTPVAEAKDNSKKFSLKKVFKKKNKASRTARPAPKLRGILKKRGNARGHLKSNHNRRVRINTNPRGRGPGYSPNRKKSVKGLFKKRGAKVRTTKAVKLRGILKKPGSKTNHKRRVRFNTKSRGKGAGYSASRKKANKKLLDKRGKRARKARAKSQHAARARQSRSTLKAAKLRHNAKKVKNLRKAKKAHKYVKAAKVMAVGTGVGAVAGLAVSAAGLDPTELALLKATDPAAYARKMRALKKNPAKYVAKNVAGNVKKVGKGVKKFGKKVGKVFKKKKKNKR